MPQMGPISDMQNCPGNVCFSPQQPKLDGPDFMVLALVG